MPADALYIDQPAAGAAPLPDLETPADAEAPETYLNRRRYRPASERAALGRAADYWELTKPEITFLVTISGLAGFLLGSAASVDGWTLFHTMLGTALTSGGSGALNHVMERRYDGLMRRTAHRPLPAGRVSPLAATLFGLLLVAAGLLELIRFVNPLTALLGALTAGTYLLVYTPLKRVTKHNTLIGTIPGGLPTLGGWAAATGELGAGGWMLFGILCAWQMPHFLALAWMYRKDYERGGYKMLPVVEPDGRSTGFQSLAYTALLVVLSLLPAWAGYVGGLYLGGVLLLGAGFLLPAASFYRTRSNRDARRLLLGSILYIPLLVLLIFVDRLV